MKNKNKSDLRKWIASDEELKRRERLIELFYNCPIPKKEILANLGLFLNGPALSRILFMHDLYQKIITVQGVVIEFGTRWGQNLALFENFRSLYEPFNFNRKIIGFDTFEGFPLAVKKDGSEANPRDFMVTPQYDKYLEHILNYHENENPVPHIKKFEIRKGDAAVELKKYLKENPETIIALAYFDLDLYEPTKACLKLIQDYLTKGSVIGFDELNYHVFPGETIAYKEVVGQSKYKICRSPYSRINSYIVIE